MPVNDSDPAKPPSLWTVVVAACDAVIIVWYCFVSEAVMRPNGTETIVLHNTQEPYLGASSSLLWAQPHARTSFIGASNIPVIGAYLKYIYAFVSINGHH